MKVNDKNLNPSEPDYPVAFRKRIDKVQQIHKHHDCSLAGLKVGIIPGK